MTPRLSRCFSPFHRSRSKKFDKPLTPLGVLIQKKSVRRALEFIENESNIEKLDRDELHHCLELNAPLEVICALIVTKSEVICARNALNRYPIHTAMEHSTSAAIIELLVISDEEALTKLDFMGRTPLHIGCQAGTITPQILDIMCSASPSTLIMEDNEGATPMEICITRGDEEGGKHNVRPIKKETLDMIHSMTGIYLEQRRKNYGEKYRQVTRRKSISGSASLSSILTLEESSFSTNNFSDVR